MTAPYPQPSNNMKHLFLTLLLVTLCAATSYAQTIKSLGYNTTNGQIVAATNVVWTNAFSFSTNTVAAQVRTNLSLGATWLTNTNVTNLRAAIGLGASNSVIFQLIEAASGLAVGDISVNGGGMFGFNGAVSLEEGLLYRDNGTSDWIFGGSGITESGIISFKNSTNAATTRTNLGLPLQALTNTSNVTTMRALAGSTNTNHPFSGSVALTNTNVLVFSNGILQSVQ